MTVKDVTPHYTVERKVIILIAIFILLEKVLIKVHQIEALGECVNGR